LRGNNGLRISSHFSKLEAARSGTGIPTKSGRVHCQPSDPDELDTLLPLRAHWQQAIQEAGVTRQKPAVNSTAFAVTLEQLL